MHGRVVGTIAVPRSAGQPIATIRAVPRIPAVIGGVNWEGKSRRIVHITAITSGARRRSWSNTPALSHSTTFTNRGHPPWVMSSAAP